MCIQCLMNLKELLVEVVRLCALGMPLAKLLYLALTRKDGLPCRSKDVD